MDRLLATATQLGIAYKCEKLAALLTHHSSAPAGTQSPKRQGVKGKGKGKAPAPAPHSSSEGGKGKRRRQKRRVEDLMEEEEEVGSGEWGEGGWEMDDAAVAAAVVDWEDGSGDGGEGMVACLGEGCERRVRPGSRTEVKRWHPLSVS